MKQVGDHHQQQALFGEEPDFLEPKDSVKPEVTEEQPVAEELCFDDEEPQILHHQELHDADDWDEVELSAATDEWSESSEKEVSEILRPPAKHRWWLKLTAAIALLLITIEGLTLANQAWQEQSLVSALYGLLFLLVVGGIVTLVLQESRKLSILHRTEKQQLTSRKIAEGEECDDIVLYCKSILPGSIQPQVKEATLLWQSMIDDTHTDAEVLRLYQDVVLVECDKKAKEVVTKWSSQAAALVALSPLAALDMLLIAWRNIRMIEEVASCYGMELGILARIRLLRLVMYNLVYAGVSEMTIDLGMQSIGADLMGKVSARAAQGFGAGLLSARLGLKSMQLCRPGIYSDASQQPKMSDIATQLRITVIELFKTNLTKK
ncbi:TIGR01620 family protein [Echinimonas agarilytica]|uniref:TIGR01620 family protein n=1 Tax=Echinimonas agarilytica TaxID=1215918 RepID=A0AA41W6T8_9GAMM|nr:TIGR01620 family protein [Echinimonas agarilytica]MCM2680015.1 TIGR01620 family protein [Echinimonas agarilytica]